MADFTWITHALWIYEEEPKKQPEPRREKVGVSANRTWSDTSRQEQAKRRETHSKN